jgi:hypothetical protein
MLNLNKKDIKLEIIQNLTWPDVFEIWRKNEAYDGSHWHAHYQSHGFKTWEDWRMSYVKPFGLEDLNWQLFSVINPLTAVPLFHGGPFRSWVEKFYEGQEFPSFTDLAQNPQVQSHQGIISFMKNFPKQTILTGVILKGEIIILEGMHRCAALALANRNGIKIETEIKIALAKHNRDSIPVVGIQINP